MIFSILTLFPGIFESPLAEGLTGKARENGVIRFNVINIRDFTEDIHRTADDAPYGGGAGMIMKVEPISRALQEVQKEHGKSYSVLLTPHGRVFDQQTALRYARLPHITLVCGRYEGIDERVSQLIDEEISIGDYILQGGETAGLVVIEAVSRLLPGVLGNAESALTESFAEGLLEYPQYTRPREFNGVEVPEVLLSGNHEEIRRWRRKESIRRTMRRRPDLLERFEPTKEDAKWVREIMEEEIAQ